MFCISGLAILDTLAPIPGVLYLATPGTATTIPRIVAVSDLAALTAHASMLPIVKTQPT
jgi:hypothetical protein